MKNLVMVIIHVIAIFVMPLLLAFTIPLHIIISIMGKDKKAVGDNDFTGPRSLTNASYQDYLVRRYDIKKNDVLNTYSLDGQTYEKVQDALKQAAIIDGGKLE